MKFAFSMRCCTPRCEIGDGSTFSIAWSATGVLEQNGDPTLPMLVLRELEAAARRGGMDVTITCEAIVE